MAVENQIAVVQQRFFAAIVGKNRTRHAGLAIGLIVKIMVIIGVLHNGIRNRCPVDADIAINVRIFRLQVGQEGLHAFKFQIIGFNRCHTGRIYILLDQLCIGKNRQQRVRGRLGHPIDSDAGEIRLADKNLSCQICVKIVGRRALNLILDQQRQAADKHHRAYEHQQQPDAFINPIAHRRLFDRRIGGNFLGGNFFQGTEEEAVVCVEGLVEKFFLRLS